VNGIDVDAEVDGGVGLVLEEAIDGAGELRVDVVSDDVDLMDPAPPDVLVDLGRHGRIIVYPLHQPDIMTKFRCFSLQCGSYGLKDFR